MAQVTLPKLYSRRTDGGVQEWSIEVDGPRYRVTSGIKDGNLVVNEWTEATPKNVGRSNETTAENQALAEAHSTWQKKRDLDYRESVEALDDDVFFQVMLAEKIEDAQKISKKTQQPSHFALPYFSQPKLDGMRMVDMPSGQWSRYGKPVVTAAHVREITDRLRETYPDLILDGELYCDRLADNFNEIISLAKRKNMTPKHTERSREFLEYHVYDVPSMGHLPFSERHEFLRRIVETAGAGPIKLVETTLVENEEAMDACFEGYLTNGYEGQILRTPDAPYENRRTYALIKRKIFQDADFVISDILPGVGNRAGMAGRVELLLPDGRNFGVDPMGSREVRRKMLERKDELVGKTGTVKFFRLTPDGKPRFGKLKVIRDFE